MIAKNSQLSEALPEPYLIITSKKHFIEEMIVKKQNESIPEPYYILLIVYGCWLGLRLLYYLCCKIIRKIRSRQPNFLHCRYCVAIIVVMEKYDHFDPVPHASDDAIRLTEILDTCGFHRIEVVYDATTEKLTQLKKLLLPSIHGKDKSLIFVYYIGRPGIILSPSQIPTILPKEALCDDTGLNVYTFLKMLAPSTMAENFYVPETKVVLFCDFRGPVVSKQCEGAHRESFTISIPYYIVARGSDHLEHDASSLYSLFLKNVEEPISIKELAEIIQQRSSTPVFIDCHPSFPAQKLCLAQPHGTFTDNMTLTRSNSDVTLEDYNEIVII